MFNLPSSFVQQNIVQRKSTCFEKVPSIGKESSTYIKRRGNHWEKIGFIYHELFVFAYCYQHHKNIIGRKLVRDHSCKGSQVICIGRKLFHENSEVCGSPINNYEIAKFQRKPLTAWVHMKSNRLL